MMMIKKFIDTYVGNVSLDDVVCGFANVKGVDLALMSIRLEIQLESAFATAEVSDLTLGVFGLLKLLNQNV